MLACVTIEEKSMGTNFRKVVSVIGFAVVLIMLISGMFFDAEACDLGSVVIPDYMTLGAY